MSRPGATDAVDVIVYVAVIGLFVRFFPAVISESFPITVLTAVLLKLVLEVVLTVKKAVVSRFLGATTAMKRLGAAVMLVLVLPGSKLLVIELTDLVFGDAVQLGGFFAVTGLVISLMLARRAVRWVIDLRRAGTPGSAEQRAAR